jgi:hypothetical protein
MCGMAACASQKLALRVFAVVNGETFARKPRESGPSHPRPGFRLDGPVAPAALRIEIRLY